jgi:homoserine kinase
MTSADNKTRVAVPATSVNLSPGFDCMALALDLWNEVDLEIPSSQTRVWMGGEGAGSLPSDKTNRIVQAAQRVLQKGGSKAADISIRSVNRIPVSSGMGSSAAAVVRGVLAANKSLEKNSYQQNLIYSTTSRYRRACG